MEIIRNGVTYTLTEDEIEAAYELQLYMKLKRAINNEIIWAEYPLGDSDLDECTVRAMAIIDNNEWLRDIYLRNIKNAIEDVCAEKGRRV